MWMISVKMKTQTHSNKINSHTKCIANSWEAWFFQHMGTQMSWTGSHYVLVIPMVYAAAKNATL